MDTILNNPFRVLGVLVGASAREITRQKTRLLRFIDAGLSPPDDDFSFPSLGRLERTQASVEEASSRLDLDSDKMYYALFWFYKGYAITDEPAFEALREGDFNKAIEIWRKLTASETVTERNASAFNNLATLYLSTLSTLAGQSPEAAIDVLTESIAWKLNLLESEYYTCIVQAATDQNFKTNRKEVQLAFLTTLQQEVSKANIPASRVVSLINRNDFIARPDFLKSITQKFIDHINAEIRAAQEKRRNNRPLSLQIGEALYKQTESDLAELKTLVVGDDYSYSSTADKLANEILQCSIDFFNDSQEKELDNDYHEKSISLVKMAQGIAVGSLMKNKAKDNLQTLEEMKEKELQAAIAILQNIKDSYENNEREIDKQVQIAIGELGPFETINMDAVRKMKRDSIKWDVVNTHLMLILNDKNLIKIKESSNQELKKEFLELLEWVNSHSTQNSVIKDILKKYEKIPPKLPFKIISSKITNTDNKPLYNKYIRYIGLILNVKVFSTANVTIYKKYINPNGTINRNTKSSPEGYTTKDTYNITSNTRSIDLSDWGNSDKCTYAIGTHYIEVYFDNYMIHRKEFVVDLAPSEKLEIELKKAEDKLKVIKNTNYYVSEIKAATNEMEEIQKFHLFRSSSEKQRQIYEQERKIANLQRKAEEEKKRQIENLNTVIYKLKDDIQNAEY